ncbi:helix-turn-helix domain-containing protein [Fibrivirga algicola]|uniref:Helix-turn-helix transcriptional regulator n=1 Tax=Fibrivirga algicola TaxID=2950420 RepID=A0ABX0QR48_9BACT|nr:helix-turn-helix transcriptional regulator [Fibrivirga algicola]NID13776.1 helix-turn-helix transcriptional regulator [Fibrivirga algicola]
MGHDQLKNQEELNSIRIGETLTVARKARKLTQTELARRAGLQPSYISQIESNDRVPTLQTLESICQVLDIPSGVILLKAKIQENISEEDQEMFSTLIKALDALYFKPQQKAKPALESAEY